MRISEILSSNERPRISCEFFPPKSDEGESVLWDTIGQLQQIDPAYVSVTYGAGGTTRDRTLRIVERIRRETELEPVAHLTCVGSTRKELAKLLDTYHATGIENILALRGDPPEGMDSFEAVAGGFAHATDLTRFVHRRGDFDIAVATYPEGHPESAHGIKDDIRYLKMKQDYGAVCAITQYFFDNEAFYRFRDDAVKAGVTIPLIPGIMPVGNYRQIVRFSAMCGARIPDWLHARLEPVADDIQEMYRRGCEIAVRQCRDLLDSDVPGLHFYTLNRAAMTLDIHRQLSL